MKLTATETIKHGPEGQTAQAGDTFEFDDKKYPESAAQMLELGSAVKAGTSDARAATAAAASTPSTAGTAKSGPLPDDFPGRAALKDAHINTYAQLRAAGDATTIPGIGDATADKINEALEA
jgi:hypothetical protein